MSNNKLSEWRTAVKDGVPIRFYPGWVLIGLVRLMEEMTSGKRSRRGFTSINYLLDAFGLSRDITFSELVALGMLLNDFAMGLYPNRERHDSESVYCSSWGVMNLFVVFASYIACPKLVAELELEPVGQIGLLPLFVWRALNE